LADTPPDFTPVTLITGFLGSGKTTLLQRLLVDPAHRGQGIGRQLARAALVQALELGLSKIIVEVVADQQPAINMFTALGFDPEALLRSHIRDRNGDFHDLIILAHMVDENWQAFGATGIDDEFGD